MQRIPLSSQASEGVNRQTRLVRVRAHLGFKLPRGCTRVHKNIERARSQAENENPEAAFDFEWMEAKRSHR